ncbi:elongation factor P maturation arginine rhamnosyltransferase EarP [Melaminivora sp.]|uniref:elongation factor P maturation arginine rhamnosyltransferase EarP n=1 Tax=Melaminivora sp. TaxID=1933032 RepID=UPI0028AA2B77|nr:elongation factor P maturation arginine rhamnosyltransferase EarP [Melaminivora sp.]
MASPAPVPAPSPSHPLPGLRWDIFCQVIDNFGDIGVCWRLAAELAARGQQVRLWTDDASALAWMAPGGAAGVRVLPWPTAGAPADGPGDVVVEAFGCEIPAPFVAAIAQAARERARAPLWLNLEYLSAEGYVERCHGLPSPLASGPAAGLTRWFFYPGFTPRTGGLLRERDLPARQAAFDRAAWRRQHGVARDALAVSLFCYEPPALPDLLAQLQAQPAAHLLVTPGRAAAALAAALLLLPRRGEGAGRASSAVAPAQVLSETCAQTASNNGLQLSISYLPPCAQRGFDELLWACDLNFVRGEDSLVRALWAGRPFVWQIYPQHDDAHHAKLHAFLDWLGAPASLRQWHLGWNGLPGAAQPLPPLGAGLLREWAACCTAARARLLDEPDLLTQLLGFARQKS